MMKYLIRAVVIVSVLSLTSCGLAQSALRVPGSILKTVGRTAGMNVNHEADSEADETRRFD